MQKWQDAYDRIVRYARIPTFPIGVKFFKEGEEVPKEARKSKIKQTICQIYGRTRVMGTIELAVPENADRCGLAAYYFGLIDFPEEFASGERSTGVYHASPKIAKKAYSSPAKLEKGRFTSIMFAPLQRIPIDPDLIVIYGNPAQILRFVQGWVFFSGEPVLGSTIGESVCSETFIAPYLAQKPQMALPCNGERVFASTSLDEASIGIPVKHLEDILIGMEATNAAGIRYPIIWNILEGEPHPASAYFIRPEPFPESLPHFGEGGKRVMKKYNKTG